MVAFLFFEASILKEEDMRDFDYFLERCYQR